MDEVGGVFGQEPALCLVLTVVKACEIVLRKIGRLEFVLDHSKDQQRKRRRSVCTGNELGLVLRLLIVCF